MRRAALISPIALVFAGAVSGCENAAADRVSRFAPDYQGVETRLLDNELVSFRVAMRGARNSEDVSRYAECAAAQYALIRGYGFARHLRTNVDEAGGIWSGDAVYTISSALPRGLKTIDAEVVAADCAENGIPMV
ncbi:MAG: hypothetical protein R6V38_05055 [Roseovarius gahaiensis]